MLSEVLTELTDPVIPFVEVFTDVWRTWLRDAGTDARVVDHLLEPIKSGSVSRRDVRERAGVANDPGALRQLRNNFV